MAPDKSFGQERTEEATPRKREETRKKGQVAKSVDLNSALHLFGVVLAIYLLQGYLGEAISSFLRQCITYFATMKDTEITLLLNEAMKVYFRVTLPIFLVAVVMAISTNAMQFGFLFSFDPIKPKLEKINPVEGFKKLVSIRTLVDLIKNICKIFLVGLAVTLVLKNKAMEFISVTNMEINQTLVFGRQTTLTVAVAAISAFMLIAMVDFFYQRYEFNKNLRMTKQEVKEEHKQTEGDPHLKSKQKEQQRRISSRRMMQEVSQATVVITNPTHFAVALKYRREEMEAPLVVAKGADLMAERIKKVAGENNVPLIENKELTQFIYKNVDIGEIIPEQVYQAVAEILALVYQKHPGRF